MTPFDYEKTQYAISLNNGEVVICWPNAAAWHALDGTGRLFQWGEISGAVHCSNDNDSESGAGVVAAEVTAAQCGKGE